ncbi:MAG TPA: glycosyl hydrolase family 18 protein [Bacteroidota bacterium]
MTNLRAMAALLILCAAPAAAQPKEIIGYFPSWKWVARNNLVTPAKLPYEKLTIINYAFFRPLPDGSIAGKDSTGDALYLRGAADTTLVPLAHRHGVRVMLSLGGWEDSGDFPEVASTAPLRAAFAHACTDAVRTYGFDGIDIDWEFPGYTAHNGTPADRDNCTALFRAVKDSLAAEEKTSGRHLLLSAALPAGGPNLAGFDVAALGGLLDMFNIMTYDFYGPWDSLANHNAPLYPSQGADTTRCVDAAFRLFSTACGIPPARINLGVPFYGHTFTHCTALNSRHTGSDTVHFSTKGAFYYDIAAVMDRFIRRWDDRAQVPYLVSKEWDMLVSYDDEESVRAKGRYIVQHDARGAIIWELTGDYMPDGMTPLLNALVGALRSGKTELSR